MRFILIAYLGTGFILLINWLLTIFSVKKALTVFNNQKTITELLKNLYDDNLLNNFCYTYGLKGNNLIIEVISSIYGSSGNEGESHAIIEKFKVKYNKFSKPVISMVAAFFIFSLSLLQYYSGMLFMIAVVSVIIAVLLKLKSDNVLSLAVKNIGEVYIRILCDEDKKRYNNKINIMNTISSKLDSQISYLKNCSNNTNNNSKASVETNEKLNNVLNSLQKIYDFSVEESKKSPFDALTHLEKSVSDFNKMITDARTEYNDNLQLYNDSLDKINEIGKVEKNVYSLSKKTIDLVDSFNETYLSVAKSIKEVCETELSEFVEDSKFTFSNLNAVTGEIYDKIKNIFNEHVENSNKICQIALQGFADITQNMSGMHHSAIDILNNINATNQNTEKAIIALCAANYKLVDLLENDISDANSSMKHFLKDSKYNLSDYFQSINVELDNLSKKIDAAIGKK